ncbi:DCN1-like protein 4 [Tanacetum coccineum]
MRRNKQKGYSNPTSSSYSSASGRAVNNEWEYYDQLYNTYANKSRGMIDPEGIERLCSDLQVAHTDVRILMLAWKMQAEKQGYFTLIQTDTGYTSGISGLGYLQKIAKRYVMRSRVERDKILAVTGHWVLLKLMCSF